jgi:ketosteroid isomerase-like protein
MAGHGASEGGAARVAQLRELFSRIDASDWDALADLFHADVVYERPGYAPLAGLQRVLDFYRRERQVASGSHELERIVVQGDAAACWGRLRGTLKSGARADIRFADVYVFADGKIKLRRSYFFAAAV